MVSGSRPKAWHEVLGRQAITAGLIFAALVGSVYAGRWIVNKPALDILIVAGSAASVLLVLVRPLWGLYAMLALIPLEGMYRVGGEATLVRIVGYVTFGAWLLHKLVRREEINLKHLFGTYVQAPLVVVFVIWIFTSVLWASDRASALSTTMTHAQLMLFYILICFEMNSEVRLRRSIMLILLAASISAVWGIIEFDDAALIRGEGALSVNGLGHMLAVLLPLPLFFRRAYPTQRWIWTLVSIIFVAGVYASVSRGAALILLSVLFMETYHARLKGVLAVVGLFTLLVVLLPLIPTELWLYRLQARGFVDQDRIIRLKVGVDMVTEKPLLGFGIGEAGNYAGAATYGIKMSSHNVYVTMLVELGVIGFTLFILILWLGIRYLQSANRIATANGKTQLSGLILALRTSYIAYSISIAFANRERAKLLWVLLALCVVCYSLARQDNADVSMNAAQQ